MKVIVFTNATGGVSVMTPVLNTNAINDDGVWLPLRSGQEPPEGYRYPTIEEVAAKDCVIKVYKKDDNGRFVLDENGQRILERIDPIPHIVIDDSELPDRDKREAWVIVGGVVGVDESRIPKPPLSTRLSSLLKQAGQQLASNPNPDDATLQLVDAVMTINGKLKDIAEDFGGDTPLYRQAALGYLNALGQIPDPSLEQARQAMIAECG